MSLPAVVRRGRAAERVVDRSSAFWPEHRSRYRWAAAQGARGRILDLGCGGGLGLSILAGLDRTEALVAVEPSAEALAVAATEAGPVTALCRAEGEHLPFRKGAFDTVVCFEVVEHVEDPAPLVAEAARVLAAEGSLLVSTPNARYTRPVDGRPRNPFHHQELTGEEFRALLSAAFETVDLGGQQARDSYGPCAFWAIPDGTLAARLRLLAWKAAYRLPPAIREAVSRAAFGRTFFPGEHDFAFNGDVDRAHALVAHCRRPRRQALVP